MISKQIGWSQESNLIYELIKQTEKMNLLLSNIQPKYHVPISKPTGMSTEANLYYEWLRSLSRYTAKLSDCCLLTTIETTTQAPR
jgi:hypothetical protein